VEPQPACGAEYSMSHLRPGAKLYFPPELLYQLLQAEISFGKLCPVMSRNA